MVYRLSSRSIRLTFRAVRLSRCCAAEFHHTDLIRARSDLLKLRQDDRVLDIGFGGGYSLLALAKRVLGGRVVGVDHFSDMVTDAADLIRAQKLQKRS